MLMKENLESGGPLAIHRSAQLLDASRCGFYKWMRQQKTDEICSRNDLDVRNEIQKVAVEFPAYGYRRITIELRNRGYLV